MTSLFTRHSRSWNENRFVYPVISRRSKGLSVGINLNPDKACNFDCVYCSVNRTVPARPGEVDLSVVREELDVLLDEIDSGAFWSHPPFDTVPDTLRRFNDVAFSGDGEPTSSPHFPAACGLAADLLANHNRAAETKIVLITNATLLHRRAVVKALDFLDRHNGEIWAKLDAGSEAYYRKLERTSVPFARVLENVLGAGRRRPIVIQSLFLKLDGSGPDDAEIDAYIARLHDLLRAGCQVKLVQVYTVARPPAEVIVTPLQDQAIDRIVGRVRELGLIAEGFYGPGQ